MSSENENRQVRKTRAAILDAFRDLMLARGYSKLSVGDIIARADVGRSTFYEHFRNKDDVLRASFGGIVGPLAETVAEEHDAQALACLLSHFRDNQVMARKMFKGEVFQLLTGVVADLIEERLENELRLPHRLIAASIAGAHFEMIRAWIHRDEGIAPLILAQQMHRNARAMVKSSLA